LTREKAMRSPAEDYERAAGLKQQLQDAENVLAHSRGTASSVTHVTAADIAEVVARATGIPVAQLIEEERTGCCA
jgi:ATP-dependent Clp protease ATP-binding subunit ClpC